ncbi:hypothetical protein [Nesterenkonia cremea]|uniref:Uncharacterized protein n=1 Tax=Nesterenkonia cremea TaxID=1882340 RepID=A0A917ALI3_9MICC|nr:hypothetical protein [Nesterenkonia cremea]GGE60612.1 hypothetical protein GCM10011401_04400 [Nesterenkonia cremea]
MSHHGYPFGDEQPPGQPGPAGPPAGPPAPPHHAQPPHPHQPPYAQPPAPTRKKGSGLVWAAWGTALTVALVAGGIIAWQVDEQLYTTEASAENYWEALRSGNGAEALGHLDSVPEDTGGDAVLLDGDPLSYSASLMEGMSFTEGAESASVTFTADGEEYETTLPVVDAGNHWLIFDDWKVGSQAYTDLEVDVPGAEAAGVGQIEVNGEPVNLEDETVTLSAFLPSVVEFGIDSQWLAGTTTEVLLPEEDDDADAEPAAQELTLELEASEEAEELLHSEVETFLQECAEQEVLMPSGCPMGIETPHQVDSDTISWDMPDAADTSLSFDSDGWEVSGLDMTATVTFEALDHHDGEELDESHDVPFRLDVQVGADGEELIISVAGE